MTPGSLWTDDATAARLLQAPSAVVLIGGFDGSANFGDVLQAKTALERVASASPFAAVALVVEAEYAEFTLGALNPPEGTIVLEFSTDHRPSLLARLPSTTLAYLYGGGYLNSSWSARRLQQFNAVADLVAAGGEGLIPRVAATGLQVSPHDELWAWAGWLQAAEPLGVRDIHSLHTLADAGVDAARVMDSSDDAVPWLLANGLHTDGDSRCFNVHLSTQDYATEDGSQRREWLTRALVELAAVTPGMRCKLLIAFDDPRISEQATAEEVQRDYQRYAAQAGTPTIEFETISLIAALANNSSVQIGAGGTITSSYHVGLASLIANVPTLLFAENPFYSQKMTALAETFDLPERAVISPAHTPPTEIKSLLGIVGAALAESLYRTTSLLLARCTAAASSVLVALCRLNRDRIWLDSQALTTHYRMLVEEVADLHERKRYLEIHAETNARAVSELTAKVAELVSGGPDDHDATPAAPPSRVRRRRRSTT